MATSVETFKGDGQVHLTDSSNAAILVPGMQAFSFSAEENEISLQNRDDGSGGKLDSIRELTAVTLTMEFAAHNAEILARALRGSTTNSGETAITAEVHEAYLNAFVPFRYQPDMEVGVTVKADSGESSEVTLQEGVDYEMSTNNNGIIIIDNTELTDTGLVNPNKVYFEYTPVDSDEIIGYQGSAPLVMVQVDGWNKAKGRPYYFEAERARLGVVQNTSLITGEFNVISVTGEILKANSSGYDNGFFKLRK